MSSNLVSVSIAVGGIAALMYANYRLKRELDHMTAMRHAERQGRIRAEQSVTKEKESSWTLFPIGTVSSVYAKRSGTPRQPGLVESAESRIEIVPGLNQAIDSLDQFSHVWVLFMFHKNTNISKRLKAKHPFDGLKLMVEPPKASGQKVGVLSCRTPHRPNPIGLSLCRVVRVEKGAIIVAGLDCLDGTPVVDIKPYLPIVEVIQDARVPHWIYQGVDEDRKVTVEWGCDRKLDFIPRSGTEETALKVIEETLSRDIRSSHQIRLGAQMEGDWEGELNLADMTVSYAVSPEKEVRILHVVPR
jgi:tRNA-Thr(GGU) m(6)t(6)A37 methyltransferase TsaA